MPDVFDTLFRHAGRSLEEAVGTTLPEPASRYVYPGGLVVDVFSDHGRTLDAIRSALGDQAAREADAFLRYAKRIWDAAAPWFVYGDAPTPFGVAKLGPRAWSALPAIDAMRSMNAGIERFVRTPELQWLFQRYATYNGSDPRKAPATLNCIAHVELGLGVHGVRGGIGALVQGLHQAAVDLGVQFSFDTKVSKIALHGGRVAAVHTEDGQRFVTEQVVANADAAHVWTDLLPEGTRHGQATDLEPSMSGWVGIVRARRTADRVGHTVLFPNDYRQEFRAIFDDGQPPATPTVYLCAQERCHARTTWDDAEPIFIMANTPSEPAHGARPAALWQDLEARVWARLTAEGLVAHDDTIVWRRSPSELAATFAGSRGSIYGAASNSPFSAFRRPPNRVRKVPGLYLASGSAHPGGGMPLCALSGIHAARAVVEDRTP